MREFVTEKVKQIKPSGIRKFFDIVSEMPDAILTLPGISVRRESVP